MTIASPDILRHVSQRTKELSTPVTQRDHPDRGDTSKTQSNIFDEALRAFGKNRIRDSLDSDIDKIQRYAIAKAITQKLEFGWGVSRKKERLPFLELFGTKATSKEQYRRFASDIGLMPEDAYQRSTLEQDDEAFLKSAQYESLTNIGSWLQSEATRTGRPLDQAGLYAISKIGEQQIVNILDAEYVLRHTQSILANADADPYHLIKAGILFRGAKGQLAAELSKLTSLQQVVATASAQREGTFKKILSRIQNTPPGMTIPSFEHISTLRQEYTLTPPNQQGRIFTTLNNGFSAETQQAIPTLSMRVSTA